MARILVADTDKSVRDLVRLRLTAWGHDVVSRSPTDSRRCTPGVRSTSTSPSSTWTCPAWAASTC